MGVCVSGEHTVVNTKQIINCHLIDSTTLCLSISLSLALVRHFFHFIKFITKTST